MIKKFFCAAWAILMLTVSVFAASGEFDISAPRGFCSYRMGQSAEDMAKILGMNAYELENYCVSDGILYLAVNENNTKQIRVSISESEFSSGISNLSNLSEDKITALIPDITGADSGEIVTKNGQSFIKITETSSDFGGEYSVISYVTVAAKKDYVLSFYTSTGTSTDYVEKVFKSFSADDFYKESNPKSYFGYVIIAAIALLALVSAYIIFTLVRDIKNERKEKST